MSNELFEGERFSVARFFGGARGVCIQITTLDGYVQLDRDEVRELVRVLGEFLGDQERRVGR